MKKYFTKTVAVFLMTAVFFMASGFCFHGFRGLEVKINVAQAASNDNNSVSYSKDDGCSDDQNGEQNSQQNTQNNIQFDQSNLPMPMTSNHNSFLSCCADSDHLSVLNMSQSVEINKIIPTLFFTENVALKTISEIAIYNIPIIPPPELFSIKTTILRL